MRIFTLPLLIAVASATQAATYYVATTGSDANAGTSTKPWATLQHAVDTINPGDVIEVEAGTYVGCRIGNPGTQAAPKTLEAAPGAHVLINAPGPSNKHDSIVEVENFDLTMTDWRILGFEVANSPKYGIDVRVTDRITVANNHVHNSTLTGIFTAFSDHVLIQANETDHNGEHGIYHSNSSSYGVIRSNRVHDNADCGIHMNGDYSEQPGNGLILFALVSGNLVYNNGAGGGSAIDCDGVNQSVIMNNLLYNNHASGISLYAIDGAVSSSYNRVYNNTIVMASGSRWPMNIPDDGNTTPPVGNVIENNILYTPDSYHGSIVVAGPKVTGFYSDYNVVVGQMSDDSDNSTITFAAWRKLGYDTHSIIATPAQLFANSAFDNFQLKAGSPAVNAGNALAIVTTDIIGTPRPQGKTWDIGCYEYKPATP
jgi:parallel beta-helix repeat protein